VADHVFSNTGYTVSCYIIPEHNALKIVKRNMGHDVFENVIRNSN